MVLQERIHNENWLQVMNVLSLLSMSEHINLWADIPLSDFRELGLDVVSEGTEFFNVDGFASLNVVANILDQGFPDDNVLGLRLKRFQVRCSSLSSIVVLSWVLISVLKNPEKLTKWLYNRFNDG